MTGGWSPDEWRWDAEPSDPQAWDPQRRDQELWTVNGRPTRDWAAEASTPDRGADRPLGPGPVVLGAAGGAVVATGLGLLVLLLGGVLVAMVLGGLVLLGAATVGAAWLRGAR